MSTTTANLESRVNELNDMILEGQILEAFEKFYAENVVMEEDDKQRVGKEANREYEEQFVNSLTDFRSAEVKAVGVDEANRTTFVQWYMDFSLEGVGDVELKQVAVQRWNDNGRIERERFYKLG